MGKPMIERTYQTWEEACEAQEASEPIREDERTTAQAADDEDAARP
jgi:hypothetical protein